MNRFFDSEVVRESVMELEELQAELTMDLMHLAEYNLQERKDHLNRLKTFLEKQKIFFFRISLSDDPDRLWIGEIISSGEDSYKSWAKRFQGLTYLFQTEVEVFFQKENFQDLFTVKGQSHPEVLKKHLQGALSIETMVILDMILDYTKDFDKKLTDPVWETVSLKIKKYKPFLNIDVTKFKSILKEQVV